MATYTHLLPNLTNGLPLCWRCGAPLSTPHEKSPSLFGSGALSRFRNGFNAGRLLGRLRHTDGHCRAERLPAPALLLVLMLLAYPHPSQASQAAHASHTLWTAVSVPPAAVPHTTPKSVPDSSPPSTRQPLSTSSAVLPSPHSTKPLPRLIALGTPAVEITCALGLEQAIIARAEWTTWPPAMLSIPSLGDPTTPNLELLLHLKPDAVLIDTHFASLKRRLERYNIPVYIVSAYNTRDVIPAVRKVGALFDRQERAERLVQELETLQQRLAKTLASCPPEQQPYGLMLAGKTQLFSFSQKSGRQILELVGAHNLCAHESAPFPILNREWMVHANPDFLLITPESKTNDREHNLRDTWEHHSLTGGALSVVPCVQRGKLMVLEGALTYGLRSLIGCFYLAKALHPALFADVNPDAIHDAFLQRWFNTHTDGRYLYP